MVFILFVYFGFWGSLPSAAKLSTLQQSQASLVYAAQGELIGSYYAVNRNPIQYQDLPPHLVEALVATEDERFFEHGGVDYRSLARVLFKTILAGNSSSGGGSTITQQLVKNLYGRPDYGWLSMPVNKVREIILALRLEGVYTKEQILELYFNTVSFSENTIGISAGSQRFFSCRPIDLEIQESAILVGLLKANTYYNPRLNPDHALGRRNIVFSQMLRNEFLSKEEVDSLKNIELKIRYRNLASDGPAPYFVAQVKKQVKEILKSKSKVDGEAWDYKTDGLKIYTSLNLKRQLALKASYQKHLAQWQKYFDQHWQGREPWADQPDFFNKKLKATPAFKQLKAKGLSEAEILEALKKPRRVELYHPAGLRVEEISSLDSLAHYLKLLRGGSVLLDPRSGGVEAWLGGPDYNYLPFDAAAAPHSMASTVKPFILTAALETGFEPCDYQSAERVVYEEYDDWEPRNYDNKYEGAYSMAGVLKKSINTATVAWFFEVGADRVRRLASKLGMDQAWVDGPTVALGSSSVSPLNLAAAYACFANGGLLVDPYFVERIESSDGKLIYERPKVVTEEIIGASTARYINSMLQGVSREGTARRLKTQYGANFPWAAKTGTSQNYSDAWLVAYSGDLVSVTWMGGVSPLIHFRTGALGSGSAMALPVFGAYLQAYGNQESYAEWPELTEEELAGLDCPDLKDPNLIEQLQLILRSDSDEDKGEEKEKDQPDTTKANRPWWKRIFKQD